MDLRKTMPRFHLFIALVLCCSFTLTLIDSLDTLVVLGDLEEFERGVRLVIDTVTFDHDIPVSVFETNIRVVGYVSCQFSPMF